MVGGLGMTGEQKRTGLPRRRLLKCQTAVTTSRPRAWQWQPVGGFLRSVALVPCSPHEAGHVQVFADWRVSLTGFPFKVGQADGTLSTRPSSPTEARL